LTARKDGSLVGVAPFYIERKGPLGLRCLQFCSEELAPDYLDILADKDLGSEITRCVIQELLGRRQWDLLSLDCLRSESWLLKNPSWFVGVPASVEPSFQCPYIRLRGTFESYIQEQKSLSGLNLKKKWTTLQHQKGVIHEVLDREDRCAQGLTDLFWLHELRVKNKQITSHFISPDVIRFHQQLGPLFFRAGILNLQILYDGKSPISAIYAFNFKKRAHVYQTGFNPDWKSFSAGSVLFYLSIEKAYRDGMDEYDFLKGMESYKSLWSNAIRDQGHLTVYNNTWRGKCGRQANRVISALKSLKRRFIPNADPTPARENKIRETSGRH
jgi:CelD/BcsL family acetyltransferase involved in cellulose biosynthesis